MLNTAQHFCKQIYNEYALIEAHFLSNGVMGAWRVGESLCATKAEEDACEENCSESILTCSICVEYRKTIDRLRKEYDKLQSAQHIEAPERLHKRDMRV